MVMSSMLSRYFHEETSVDTSVSMESLLRVYDSIEVEDAFGGVKTRTGSSVMAKEKKEPDGFVKGVFKEFGKALLSDITTLATAGVLTLDDIKNIKGVQKFREWLSKDRRSMVDLANASDEVLKALLKSLKDSGEFENKDDLFHAVEEEISHRKKEAQQEERSKKDTDRIRKSADLPKDVADQEVDKALDAAEEDAADKVLGRIEGILDDPEFSDKWDAAEDADVVDDDNLPWPVLEDLQAIAVGRVSLPKGHYLLSATGVTPESVENYTVSWVIDGGLQWKAYQDYLNALSNESLSSEDFARIVDAVEATDLTAEYEGQDFMDYLINNEVSGDIEVAWGFMPARDMPKSFVAVVNKTNNAFTLFAPRADVASMIPIGGM